MTKNEINEIDTALLWRVKNRLEKDPLFREKLREMINFPERKYHIDTGWQEVRYYGFYYADGLCYMLPRLGEQESVAYDESALARRREQLADLKLPCDVTEAAIARWPVE